MTETKKDVQKSATKQARKADDGYTILTSPSGSVTTVPNEIKDVLIESGYTE